jgi:hypothetical protein
MNFRDTRTQQRAAALAILALVVAVPIYLGVLVAGAFSDSVSGDAVDAQNAVNSLNDIIAHRTVASANLGRVREAYKRQPFLLGSKTSAEATAILEDQTKALILAQGGNVDSAEVLPSDMQNGLRRVGIRYSLNLPPDNFPRLLASIESHVPYLIAKNLKVEMPESTSGGQAMTLEIDIFGFLGGAS